MNLDGFIQESNRIEGIHRPPTKAELQQTARFLSLPAIHISDLIDLVAVYQPNARPRFVQGLDVRVGDHIPPRGGPNVQAALLRFLEQLQKGQLAAYKDHLEYEMLHPFTDGNGRSGRAVWLWQMGGDTSLGFLHHFYYQTLRWSRA